MEGTWGYEKFRLVEFGERQFEVRGLPGNLESDISLQTKEGEEEGEAQPQVKTELEAGVRILNEDCLKVSDGFELGH